MPADQKKACELYERAAHLGYAIAQGRLGNNYFDGKGVKKDNQKSFFYTLLAANFGDSQAQHNVSNRYGDGEGVNKSLEKRIMWLHKAAAQGLILSINTLILIDSTFDPGPEHVFQNLERGSKEYMQKLSDWLRRGNPPLPWAMYHMGEIYFDGSGEEWGMKQSYETALKAFQSAAQQGHPMSHVCLGQAYMFGDGVAKDLNKSYHYFERAIDQTLQELQPDAHAAAVAFTFLGVMAANGEGCEQSDLSAREWWAKAHNLWAKDVENKFSYADGIIKDNHGQYHHVGRYLKDYNKMLRGKKVNWKHPEEERTCAECGQRMVARAKTTKRCPCFTVYYCDKDCQIKNWKTHKNEHKRIMKEMKVNKVENKETENRKEQDKKKERERFQQQQKEMVLEYCPHCSKVLPILVSTDDYLEEGKFTRMLCCGKGIHHTCVKQRQNSNKVSRSTKHKQKQKQKQKQNNSCVLCGEMPPKARSPELVQRLHTWVEEKQRWAMIMLADRYASGTGCSKSLLKACKYWKLGADAGCMVSQYNMGIAYYEGHGVEKNMHLSSEYYRMAALQGDANSQYVLGSLTAINKFGRHEFVAYLMKEFPTMSMEEIMENEECMKEAVGWRIDTARDWVKKAADQGHKNAIKYLELEQNDTNKHGELRKKKLKKKKKKKKKR